MMYLDFMLSLSEIPKTHAKYLTKTVSFKSVSVDLLLFR